MSNRKFYLVTWKRQHYNYKDLDQSTYKAGIQGPQLKVVCTSIVAITVVMLVLTHIMWKPALYRFLRIVCIKIRLPYIFWPKQF